MRYKSYLMPVLFLQFSFNSCTYCQQNKRAFIRKDTEVVYNLLKQTDSEFITERKNVSINETKNNYYEKKYYVNSNLVKVEQYDKNGNLFDDTYSQAIVTYEYDSLKRKTKIMLFDKNQKRIEDGFEGYWAIEYYYDKNGKKIKQVAKDTSNNIVKYNPSLTDLRPPIVEFSYKEKKIHVKVYDENYKLVNEYDCDDVETCWQY